LFGWLFGFLVPLRTLCSCSIAKDTESFNCWGNVMTLGNPTAPAAANAEETSPNTAAETNPNLADELEGGKPGNRGELITTKDEKVCCGLCEAV
jgi:hypothetical protein